MKTNKIFVFCEGSTEEIIFRHVRKNMGNVDGPFQKTISVDGKNNFRSKIIDDLSPEFKGGEPGSCIGVLAFRDRDAGEQESAIQNAFESIAHKLLLGRPQKPRPKLAPVPGWPNIFILAELPTSEHPGLRFVLHLAAPPQLEELSLRNATTDGYVLALALKDGVLKQFASDKKIKSTSDVLRRLVTYEVPETLLKQGIGFDEDKDYLGAYLCASRFWTVKRTEDKERLLKIILDRASPLDSRTVLASWEAAIKEIAQ